MFGAILMATNSSFQKGLTFCCSIYVKKVMKLIAFIFEQPSYISSNDRVLEAGYQTRLFSEKNAFLPIDSTSRAGGWGGEAGGKIFVPIFATALAR